MFISPNIGFPAVLLIITLGVAASAWGQDTPGEKNQALSALVDLAVEASGTEYFQAKDRLIDSIMDAENLQQLAQQHDQTLAHQMVLLAAIRQIASTEHHVKSVVEACEMDLRTRALSKNVHATWIVDPAKVQKDSEAG